MWYANAVQTCCGGIPFSTNWPSQSKVIEDLGNSIEV